MWVSCSCDDSMKKEVLPSVRTMTVWRPRCCLLFVRWQYEERGAAFCSYDDSTKEGVLPSVRTMTVRRKGCYLLFVRWQYEERGAAFCSYDESTKKGVLPSVRTMTVRRKRCYLLFVRWQYEERGATFCSCVVQTPLICRDKSWFKLGAQLAALRHSFHFFILGATGVQPAARGHLCNECLYYANYTVI